MSVELRPLGVSCNIRCQYCYQNPQRDVVSSGPPYDLAAMQAAIEAEGGPFGLFGGEPLLVPESDLELLWAWGLERFGGNFIQTNATLITDRHIELFKRYRVHVGISIDGPEALNDARWAGTLERTREATALVESALSRLCAAGIPPNLIITLHRGNASHDRLPRLRQWLSGLTTIGVRSIRLHPLEVEDADIRRAYALSTEENLAALRSLSEIAGLRIDVFTDLDKMLSAQDAHSSCVWRACDPYTTAAVRGVEGNGQRSNCGRTNKDGVEFQKADRAGYERYIALYQTPQEAGGCQGCRFFLVCKGQCPGTAIDHDWRNRSEHCAIWKDLFTDREAAALARGEQPLSLAKERELVEWAMLKAWARGDNPSLTQVVDNVRRGFIAPPTLAPVQRTARICWISAAAMRTWQPRFERIRVALAEAEWRSIGAGIRRCAVQSIRPEKLRDHESTLERAGLSMRLLGDHLHDGELLRDQVAMGSVEDLRALVAAWQREDHEAIGELLGYPPCCRRAFSEGRCLIGAPTQPQENVLLRALGLCLLPHDPCGPNCPLSIALADRMLAQCRALGYEAEADWLVEILRWPVSRTRLHHIAEVKTPMLKFARWEDSAASQPAIHYQGSAHPELGAAGVRFPYRRPPRLKVTESQGHKLGLEHAAVDVLVSRLVRRVQA